MFVNDLFKLIENSNEEYYAVYNQRGKPMIMRKPVGKTAKAYAEEKNLTIKGGPFGSHQETESFWIRSALPGKDKKVDEDRFDKDDQTVRLPSHMTGRDPSKPSVDIPGTPYTVSMRGDDATTQQDARHLGTFLSSVPMPLTKAAGMAMRYAGQYDKLPTGEKVARAMDSAGAPSVDRHLDLERQRKAKPMKEQDIDPDSGPERSPYPPEKDFPNWYDMRDRKFEVHRNDGTIDFIQPGTDEWNDIYDRQFPDHPRPNNLRDVYSDGNPVAEAGPFSYSARKPRKGSVADLAAKKRKEQEKGRQPVEPRDQMVGVARVVKEFAPSGGGGGRWYSDDQLYEIIGEDWLEAFDVSGDQGNIDLNGERARLFLAQEAEAWLTDHGYRVNVLDVRDDGDSLSWYIQGPLYKGVAEGGFDIPEIPRAPQPRQEPKEKTTEGSVQDKLYQRHQELRKKRGLPDPNYYKELKATHDLPDGERYKKAAELKKKYGITNEDRERYVEELGRAGYEIVTEAATLCPECGGAAYADRMLAEKQDACYHKVKSRYKVWPSAYASGALVRCRKKGAANWGNKSKK